MTEKVERYGEHVQTQRQRENEFARKVRVKTAVEIGNEAITDREYYRLACIVRDKLIPDLVAGRHIRQLDEAVDDDNWEPAAVSRFDSHADMYVAALAPESSPASSSVDALSYQKHGFQAPKLAAKKTTIDAFKALEALAAHENLIREEMRNFVDATGYSLTVGRMWKRPTMHISDPVQVVSRDSGLTKTLLHGGTGQGKSTTLGTEAEDRYNINHPDRPNSGFIYGCKLLDILDFREGENMVYDVPQQDETLRRIRAEHGLPPTFEESDDLLTPETEILVPLTPSLNECELPYDTDEDEFAIRPFTIPASSLSKPLLVSLMSSLVTSQQETTIRTAYDSVAQSTADWTLKDLAKEIMDRDDLGGSYQKRVARLLENIQNMGFIRDSQCPYALGRDDWQEIFEDTRTITSFSMAFMEQMVGKLMVTGWILDSIDSLRESEEYPDAVIVMRELHKAAPHREESSFDRQEEALQDVIAKRLSLLQRENRHRGVALLGDTQDILHLKKGFRKGFNRFVTFNTSEESLKELFEYTSTENWRSCKRSLTVKKGEGAVIGQAKPLVQRDDLDYLGHVEFVPPSWHHLDTDKDPSGWKARAAYLDNEELRYPAFQGAQVPGDLIIDETVIEPDEGVDSPMEAFVDDCLVVTGDTDDFEHTAAVRRAYNAWAHAEDQDMIQSNVSFGKKINAAVDELEKKWRDGGQAYVGIRFNPLGSDYAQAR